TRISRETGDLALSEAGEDKAGFSLILAVLGDAKTAANAVNQSLDVRGVGRDDFDSVACEIAVVFPVTYTEFCFGAGIWVVAKMHGNCGRDLAPRVLVVLQPGGGNCHAHFIFETAGFRLGYPDPGFCVGGAGTEVLVLLNVDQELTVGGGPEN